jgi:hypothetical protein
VAGVIVALYCQQFQHTITNDDTERILTFIFYYQFDHQLAERYAEAEAICRRGMGAPFTVTEEWVQWTLRVENGLKGLCNDLTAAHFRNFGLYLKCDKIREQPKSQVDGYTIYIQHLTRGKWRQERGLMSESPPQRLPPPRGPESYFPMQYQIAPSPPGQQSFNSAMQSAPESGALVQAHSPPPTALVTIGVVVPPGVLPGQMITVVGPSGAQFVCQVPVGATPGSQFLLQVPAY